MTEDFSTYTSVGTLTITDDRVTATNLKSNENRYLYKDFGSGFFKPGWMFKFAAWAQYVHVWNHTNPRASIFTLGNNVNVVNGLTGNYVNVLCRTNQTSSASYVQIFSNVDSGDVVYIESNTVFYYAITLKSNETELKVYSDAGYSSLVGTSVCTTSGATYRYLYPLQSYNLGAAYTDTENVYHDSLQMYRLGGGAIMF